MGLVALPERDAFAARRATIATALLLLFTDCGFAAIERAVHGDIHWMYLAHAMLGALIALLLWRSRMASARWSLVAYVVLVLPMLPIVWVIDARALTSGAPWQPFTGAKLVVLGLIVLTPRSTAAAALLAIFIAEWALFWNHFALWTHPAITASGEPWVVLLYFMAGLLLVWMRWHNHRLDREQYERDLEAQTIREVSQVATAVRDLASTPLQNLELSIADLRSRHPEEQLTLERMDRSVGRLTDLRPLSDKEKEMARVRVLRTVGEHLE